MAQMKLYAWSDDSYTCIEDAISSGALHHIADLTTIESNCNIIDLSRNSEVMDAVDVCYNTAKFLGYEDSVHVVIGTTTEIFYLYEGNRVWKTPTIKHSK